MPLIKEIEALARLRTDGTLTEAEFVAAKEAILKEVPEAEPVRTPDPLLALLVKCLVPPGLVGLGVNALGIPPMLSLTLAVTVLAAILVAQFRETER